MKVWKKNMLIAAGGLLAVGVIFCGIGLATGAKSVNYHNGKITIGDKLMGNTSFSSQNIADILPLKEKQTISSPVRKSARSTVTTVFNPMSPSSRATTGKSAISWRCRNVFPIRLTTRN